MLDTATQATLVQLGVFRGTFDQDAAYKIVRLPQSADIDAYLGNLRRRSLLNFNIDKGRYNLHELVRVFARTHLEKEALEQAEDRFIVYFTMLAQQAEPHLTDDDQHTWLNLLEAENHHFNEVFTMLFERQDMEQALQQVKALWRFWERRGHVRDGQRLLSSMQAVVEQVNGPTSTRLLADIWKIQGTLYYQQGAYQQAQQLLEQSLEFNRSLGRKNETMRVLNNLGLILYHQNQYQSAEVYYQEVLAIAKELKDTGAVAAVKANLGLTAQDEGRFPESETLLRESIVLFNDLHDRDSVVMHKANLANTLSYQGKFLEALDLHKESLQVHRDLEDPWGIASSLNGLGWVLLELKRDEEAAQHFQESLKGFGGDTVLAQHDEEIDEKRDGDIDKDGLMWCFEGFAVLALHREFREQTVRLFAYAEHLRTETNGFLPPSVKPNHDLHIEQLREKLGSELFNTYWKKGEALTLEQAVKEALALTVFKRTPEI